MVLRFDIFPYIMMYGKMSDFSLRLESNYFNQQSSYESSYVAANNNRLKGQKTY